MSTTQTSVQHAVPKTNSLGRREAARVCGHRRAQERCGPASRNLVSLPYPLFWCSWRSAETGFISKSDERPGPCPCSPRGLQDRRCRGSLRKEAPTRIASVLRHRFFLSNVPGADLSSEMATATVHAGRSFPQTCPWNRREGAEGPRAAGAEQEKGRERRASNSPSHSQTVVKCTRPDGT